MGRIAIQISPEAKGAYFADYLDVARKELEQVCGINDTSLKQIGALDFFELDETATPLNSLLRLSFCQGLYHIEGDLLRPIDETAGFYLHEDFVFGSKFRGKTNEHLTQLLINIGLSSIDIKKNERIKLLDPMCGRGTTLLWAMRYGLESRGIEQESKALADIHRNLKKWTKLHRQKHKLSEGSMGEKQTRSKGKFLEFSANDCSMRVVTGDSRDTDKIFRKEKFDLIISDLPYGIQHFTTTKTRDPIDVIKQSVEPWKQCLKKGGAIVLAYNRYNPKRDVIIEAFEQQGLTALPFSAEHRMSESIVRDVVVFRHATED